MDRLDELRAFVLAVDQGSLSAVARTLGRSSASITRAIDALEGRLGTPLLRRTTRSLALTEAGTRYLVVARRVLTDLDDAAQTTSAELDEPRGVLTITAPIAFGSLHVRPLVDEVLRAHPGLRARLVLLDRTVNVVEEGFDVAIRVGHLADSTLVATRVGLVRRMFVASPAYLARAGRPRTPDDLAAHACITTTALGPADTWTFGATAGARSKRMRLTPLLSVNVADAAIRSAASGMGITSALSYQLAEHLASGALVRVLQRFEPPPVPVHVLSAATSTRLPKVRAFVSIAAPRLRTLLEPRRRRA